MQKVEVIAIAIHVIRKHAIQIYARDATGKHGNEYVKVTRRGIRGKFLLANMQWESKPDIEASVKKEIEDWIKQNINAIKKQIKELN